MRALAALILNYALLSWLRYLLLAAYEIMGYDSSMNKVTPSISSIIAHRGASAYAPENTLVAIQMAYEMGARTIECDVSCTKDNQLVMFHDPTLAKKTAIRGRLQDMTWPSVSVLDVGSWFGQGFKSICIPRLSQVLDLCSNLGVTLNLDIKCGRQCPRLMAQLLIHDLAIFWKLGFDKLIVSSESLSFLNHLRSLAPQLPLGLIASRFNPRTLKPLKAIYVYSFHLNGRFLIKKDIQTMLSHGFKVMAYTINDSEKAQALFDMGVCAVFTDAPDLMNQP